MTFETRKHGKGRAMRTFSAFLATVLTLVLTTYAANAKIYQVHFLSEKALEGICKGHGSFSSGENSYSCTYKNGNIRECNKKTKKCMTDTQTIKVQRPKHTNGLVQPGLLEAGPGLSTTGPAGTGTPMGKSSPAPGQLR